ncbi:DUF6299 family protein [Streptomyces sp. MBT42]|uniref:DUF6299 family protein n=1 Tax=Streptomyces sp. MBT42 TaxID=1488373 RepID=UPI001E33F03F|nr:DUF6299 family protein [Streptomyces sp. MBT42]MCD2467749.1 DUF6299 family protein [Streptomyces sp. MBT42]
MRVRLVLAAGVLLASAAAPLAHAGGADGLSAGPALDGPVLNGPVLYGPVLDGHVLNGPALNGPALDDRAPGSRAADDLTVYGYGTVGDDSTVTLSGMYRCLDDSAGPVFVSSTLVQGNRSAGIGGTQAVCDGHLHEWVNTSVVKDPAYRPGSARVRATLMQLTADEEGLPTPGFLAAEDAAVVLR